MKIEALRTCDIGGFLTLAAGENWMSEQWELAFLLSIFPQGCFAARLESGETVGFVTSICHERSGWIGNLIVADEHRGKGIGKTLFTVALGALRTAGAKTFWLTASKSGLPLYQKHGFVGIDTIYRWSGEVRQRHASFESPTNLRSLTTSEADVDFRAWGDRRCALLAATTRRGRFLHDDSGFIALQPCVDSVQFGPFSAVDSICAERLFEAASRNVVPGTKVFVDAPALNRASLRIFHRKQMKIVGSNLLMYAGKKPNYRPELIYGLATMGSCG